MHIPLYQAEQREKKRRGWKTQSNQMEQSEMQVGLVPLDWWRILDETPLEEPDLWEKGYMSMGLFLAVKLSKEHLKPQNVCLTGGASLLAKDLHSATGSLAIACTFPPSEA